MKKLHALAPLFIFGLGCSAQTTAVLPPRSSGPPSSAASATCAPSPKRGHAKILTAALPSGTRVAIESRLRSGLVAVHYDGCELRVLPECTLPGAHAWVGATNQDEHLTIGSASDVSGHGFVAPGNLIGLLQQYSELHLHLSAVGTYEIARGSMGDGRTSGDCTEATHMLVSVTAGAFELEAGGKSDALVASGGDRGACRQASIKDREPPEGCGAPLQLDLEPIEALKKLTASKVCPSGTAWDGRECREPTVAPPPPPQCPPNTEWNGMECAVAAATCPAGTRMNESGQCVSGDPPASAVPPKPKPTCACAPGDLRCSMKCAQHGGNDAAPPPPPRPPNNQREFDRSAATAALATAAASAKSCKKADGPAGAGKVKVTFAPSGAVSSVQVDGPPYAGTPVGGCVAAVFRGARVPPFDGAPVSVTKSFTIP